MDYKLGSSEKTPVATLHEFCVQNGEILVLEKEPHKINPKMFSYIATAFDFSARGSGRSKKEAQHDASANLIAKLANEDRFKQTFHKVPVTPRPTSDTDAVMTLRNICVQRNWPLPKFYEMQACGESHSPIFTHVCELASIKRTGTFSTKKGAKQRATRAVIDIVQNFEENEEHQQIAAVDAKPLPTYIELRDSHAKLWAPRVCDRHNYFLQLPKVDRNEARKILMDVSSSSFGTSKNKVELACAALKLKYDVKDIPNHQHGHKIFYLLGNHNCVIAAKEDDLYDRVIDHFETMLNLQKF